MYRQSDAATKKGCAARADLPNADAREAMALNPALVPGPEGLLVPAPFPGENLLCARGAIKLEANDMPEGAKKWSASGRLFLSNMRMVFVTDKPGGTPEAPVRALDLPLVYIRRDTFNQPIFGCNNLAGECWPVAADGGPNGSRPPLTYALYFREGGVGTFVPLYGNVVGLARTAERDRRRREAQGGEAAEDPAFGAMKQALVDPNDPTQLFLTQPVGEDARLPDRPVYAANYGADEKYEPLI